MGFFKSTEAYIGPEDVMSGMADDADFCRDMWVALAEGFLEGAPADDLSDLMGDMPPEELASLRGMAEKLIVMLDRHENQQLEA